MPRKRGAGQHRKKRRSNRRYLVLAIVLVTVFGGLISFRLMDMEQQNAQYAARQQELQDKIEEENSEHRNSMSMRNIQRQKEFAEKVAREKFGLIYDDELKFKAE